MPELARAAAARAASLAPGMTGTWTAVVTADRAYYDQRPRGGRRRRRDDQLPRLRRRTTVPAAGTEVRIGRRSSKSAHQPDIDLTGPPADPGVSRLHAELRRSQDGTGPSSTSTHRTASRSTAATSPSGIPIPLQPGDSIHLGAWTRITLTRG